jgi:hypothetical protein
LTSVVLDDNVYGFICILHGVDALVTSLIMISDLCYGFRTVMIESPLRNSFDMNLSLLTGFPFFGSSTHISVTSSKTILQCLSKALTRPKSRLLFLQLIRIWAPFLTASLRIDVGPAAASSMLMLDYLRVIPSCCLSVSE